MKKILLERLETSEDGTFGKIYGDNFNFYTGELPWNNNKPSSSCIPEGLYKCVWNYSRAFKRFMYLVTSVEGRSGIRIHSANFMGNPPKKKQLQGCIALGKKFGKLDGQKCVLVSATAVREFENFMEKEPFILEIKQWF